MPSLLLRVLLTALLCFAGDGTGSRPTTGSVTVVHADGSLRPQQRTSRVGHRVCLAGRQSRSGAGGSAPGATAALLDFSPTTPLPALPLALEAARPETTPLRGRLNRRAYFATPPPLQLL